MSGMLPIHERMAEIWTVNQKRELTEAEMKEMHICMQANSNYARKLGELHNLSLMASMVDDYAWQHEICAAIEKLEATYGAAPKV